MPRTRKKPEAQSATLPPAAANGSASEVFTLAEAAAYLRIAEADVLRMIQEQALPARQVGAEWRFFKTAIQQWLSSGSPPVPSNKEAWMAFVGKWKDDPYLEDMVEEIYRRRGRPITEDGSYRLFHGLGSESERK
jgi:excisionase family DNA binding protein